MKKQIITLALMAIFAIGANAQDASQLIEKYREIPKSKLHKIRGKKLQKELKKSTSNADYEYLKGINNVLILVVEPTIAQREAILADIQSLDGFFLLDEFDGKNYAGQGKANGNVLATLNDLAVRNIQTKLFAKGDSESLSEILYNIKFNEKNIIVHITGTVPTSKAGDIVRYMLRIE